MNPFYRLYHPEVFQGSLKRNNYFEGWFFKHVSADTGSAFAAIPGISLSEDNHSFVQFIDGDSGKTSYFRYHANDFIFNRERLEIHVGKSFFSERGIDLELEDEHLSVTGRITYSEILKLPKSLFMPGIMGWYSFIPSMECNHGVVSCGHRISGSVSLNGQNIEYTGGNGYIEKDWGSSFPESWLWLQCNNFPEKPVSVMISVAKIPWRGSYFMGFISFFSMDNKVKILATYNGAKVERLKRIDNSNTEVILKKGTVQISATIAKKGAGTLKAPSNGLMKNLIKESLNSEVFLEVQEGGKVIFSGKGVRAGYEETDRIFSYF